MKSTELRIGNIVLIASSKAVIDAIDDQGVNGYYDDGIGGMNYAEGYGFFENIKPIPLTEEWEERCGVVRRTLMGTSYETRFVDSMGIPEWVRFVHDLQNWYYYTFAMRELIIVLN